MHPGPVNRGVEIASELADSPNSTILDQVRNGLAVRMAVLDLLGAWAEPSFFGCNQLSHIGLMISQRKPLTFFEARRALRRPSRMKSYTLSILAAVTVLAAASSTQLRADDHNGPYSTIKPATSMSIMSITLS